MISHIVSTFSGKPIFGQDGPRYLYDISKRTICRELRYLNKQNTIVVSHSFYLLLVITFSLSLSCYIQFTDCLNQVSTGYNPTFYSEGTSASLDAGASISAYFFPYSLFFPFFFLFSSLFLEKKGTKKKGPDGVVPLILNRTFKIKGEVLRLVEKKRDKVSNWVIFAVFTTLLVLVKIFVYPYNPQITKARILQIYKSNITLNSGLSMLVGISEAIRPLFLNLSTISFSFFLHRIFKIKGQKRESVTYHKSTKTSSSTRQSSGLLGISFVQKRCYSNIPVLKDFKDHHDNTFNQWLAGLIDGDGCFQLSKKGYASLEIVMETRDKHCLYQVKQKFGGSVKLRSGVKWLRYRLHHKKGLLDLINAVSGEIRNPVRLLQLNKICEKYDVPFINPSPLTYENGWFSGFFDSDGSVYLNLLSSQMFITASQKNKYILEPLLELYGGSLYIQKDSFKWVVYRKPEIIKLLDYFLICPSRSAKHNRLKAINRYHELRDLKAHSASPESILGKAWRNFIHKWEKWEKI